MQTQGSAQYLNAYLNGMQFVLLALEGKLAAMDRVTREGMTDAMYEYHDLAMRLRERLQKRIAAGAEPSPTEWEDDAPERHDAPADDPVADMADRLLRK